MQEARQGQKDICGESDIVVEVEKENVDFGHASHSHMSYQLQPSSPIPSQGGLNISSRLAPFNPLSSSCPHILL